MRSSSLQATTGAPSKPARMPTPRVLANTLRYPPGTTTRTAISSARSKCRWRWGSSAAPPRSIPPHRPSVKLMGVKTASRTGRDHRLGRARAEHGCPARARHRRHPAWTHVAARAAGCHRGGSDGELIEKVAGADGGGEGRANRPRRRDFERNETVGAGSQASPPIYGK